MDGSVIVSSALDVVGQLLPSFYGALGIMAAAILVGVVVSILRRR